ncbi:hypothetical protein D9M69_562270 [compost metagenome]
MDATAGNNDRGLCRRNQRRGLRERCVRWPDTVDGPMAQVPEPRSGRCTHFRTKKVRRKQQGHRSRAARRRSGECGVDIIVDAFGDDDTPYPLGAGLEESDLIQVLEGIPIRLIALDILHKRNDRHAGFQRLGKRRHKQRCRRAILRRDDTDLAGNPGIAVGHRTAHILLPVGDLANADGLGGENDG